MNTTTLTRSAATLPVATPKDVPVPTPYGPTRFAPLAIGPLLAAALDEVDVGLALVDPDARALHLNHRAQECLADGTVLTLRDGRIAAPHGEDALAVARALRDAAERGLRRLIHIGRADARRSAAVVPVQLGVAALMLGRSHLGEDLSLHGLARAHSLAGRGLRTGAKTSPCKALRGRMPSRTPRRASSPRWGAARPRRRSRARTVWRCLPCGRRSAPFVARQARPASASCCAWWRRCRRSSAHCGTDAALSRMPAVISLMERCCCVPPVGGRGLRLPPAQ